MADGSRSSSLTGPPQNALLRWLIPSIPDLVFVALLLSFLFTPLSVKLLEDAGIGWHIRTGQLIRATHAIPREDPFSSQIHLPWIAWEWLYDIVVGQLDASAGLNGVVWFTAAIIATTFAAMFRLMSKRGADLVIALVLTLLAISASMIHFLARPHVLSWFFVLLWFWILDSKESSRSVRSRLWLLPLLMLVWVNVHGGFLLGFVLLAIFWVGAAWAWFRLNDSRIEEALEKIAAGKRVRDLSFVGIVSLLVTLVNPYGWHLHEHIYSYLSSSFFMNHIEEFQSPNFHGVAQRCFLVLLLIAIATLAVNPRKLRASHVLLMLFAVYAGLYASRNIPVASVLLALIIAPNVPSLGLSRFTAKMGRVDSNLRGHLWPIVATVATLLVAFNGTRTRLMNAHFDPQRMPVQAVDYIERAGMKTSVFSPDYWGGYVIYRLYPRNKVAIDDRHDLYREPLMEMYLTTMHLERGWKVLIRWHQCVLLPRKAALATMLSESPEWKVIYSDDVAIIFSSIQIAPEK